MIELFQNNFDFPDGGEAEIEVTGQVNPAVPPSLSPAEVADLLDVARREAYAEGFDAGSADAAKDAANEAAQLSVEVAEKVTGALTALALQAEVRQQRADLEVIELVSAVLTQTNPLALQEQGETALQNQLQRALHCAAHSRGITLYLAPDMAAQVTSDLTLWKRQVPDGFEIKVEADPSANPHDLRATWNGGGLTYDPAAALTAMKDILETAAADLRRETTTEG